MDEKEENLVPSIPELEEIKKKRGRPRIHPIREKEPHTMTDKRQEALAKAREVLKAKRIVKNAEKVMKKKKQGKMSVKEAEDALQDILEKIQIAKKGNPAYVDPEDFSKPLNPIEVGNGVDINTGKEVIIENAVRSRDDNSVEYTNPEKRFNSSATNKRGFFEDKTSMRLASKKECLLNGNPSSQCKPILGNVLEPINKRSGKLEYQRTFKF